MNLRRFGIWTNLLVSAVLMLAVWALLVWVASRPALRGLIDLTPQRVNTVSSATVDLLHDLRAEGAEVEFHLFRGELGGQARDERHAQEIAIRSRLLELTTMLLRRYAALGGESVNIVEHDSYRDPAGYREAAQSFQYTTADAEALVVALRPKGKERRFRKLSLVSDLAVIDMGGSAPNGMAKANTLPVLKDYQGEKGISSALKGLLVQGTPVVYLLEGISYTANIKARDHKYNRFLEAMTETGLEVRKLNLREAGGVPADAAMVIGLEPTSEILPRDADYLYAYVRRGGRLFLNYVWSAVPDMNMNPTGGRLGELLGFELSTQPVFHRIPDRGRGGGSMDGTDGVMRLTLQKNPFHPTTKRMNESGRVMEVFLAREVRQRRDRPQNVRIEELLATGGEGWLATESNGQIDLRSPSVGLRPYVVGLACELDAESTTAKDVDPSKPKDAAKDSSNPSTGRAVIVAGVFANDDFFPYFGDFALNICNWMTERKVLLDIETARYRMNSLDVQLPQRERIWSLLVLYVPGAFLLCGLLVWWRRRH